MNLSFSLGVCIPGRSHHFHEGVPFQLLEVQPGPSSCYRPYLTAPCISVYSERLFSAVAHRIEYNCDNAEMLIFIRKNLVLIHHKWKIRTRMMSYSPVSISLSFTLICCLLKEGYISFNGLKLFFCFFWHLFSFAHLVTWKSRADWAQVFILVIDSVVCNLPHSGINTILFTVCQNFLRESKIQATVGDQINTPLFSIA